MFEGITKALETSDCVVYPVGSAHIHNNETPDEKRLGGLLVSEEGIDLKLANYYQDSSPAFETVNKDIKAF